MPEIQVRSVLPADLPKLIEIDHNTSTRRVWQMTYERDNGAISVRFQERRLPRSVKLPYPRDPREIAEIWKSRPGMLVAEVQNGEDPSDPVGYIHVAGGENQVARVPGMAVSEKLRRQGIATALLLAAQDLARQHKFREIVLEIHARNVPAIHLAQKLRFEFCGYRDRYYAGRDTALFFGKSLG